jgi:6-phosphogluconolactonase
MTTKVVPGMLIATPDANAVAREAAGRMGKVLRSAIEQSGRASFALSGGNTPRPAYAILAEDTRIDFSKVDIYWIDERAVPPDSDRSNYRLAKEALFDPAKIPAANIHRMRGEAVDLAQAAKDYDQLLRAKLPAGHGGAPAFDLAVLGVGDDGHVASLFPGEPTLDETRRAVVNVPASGKREARLSVTAPVIEAARAAIVLAVGRNKQDALERVWSTSGDIHHTPARIIRQIRGSITWVIDKAAGGLA